MADMIWPLRVAIWAAGASTPGRSRRHEELPVKSRVECRVEAIGWTLCFGRGWRRNMEIATLLWRDQ